MRKYALLVFLVMVSMSLGNVSATTSDGRSSALQDVPQAATPTPTPAPASTLPRFVLTLVLGAMQPGKPGEYAPQGPAKAVADLKAIADLKDFLPYKSYRALDTVFMIGFGTPNHPVQGPDGRPYELRMRGTASATAANLSLQLMDAKPPVPSASPWLIDTSFKLEAGETIVVGTSRLDGARALLVLVTWVK